ncbi:hypothetical protein GQX74_007668 [Glossina fuscipes]|nr:hypothetical protein GQX74_007668 [Glossina fuscipes]
MYATIMKTVTLFTLELGNCFTYRLTDHAVFCLDFALTLKTNQGGVWLCYFSLHFMFLEQSLLLIVFYISSSSLILGYFYNPFISLLYGDEKKKFKISFIDLYKEQKALL